MIDEVFLARANSAKVATNEIPQTAFVDLFLQYHVSTYTLSTDVGNERLGKQTLVLGVEKS